MARIRRRCNDGDWVRNEFSESRTGQPPSAGALPSFRKREMTSRARKISCLSAIVALAVLGLLLLAFGDPEPLPYPYDGMLFVSMHGTLMGHASLAAAWCALGPFSFARRLAISSGWLASIVLAFGCNHGLASHYHDLDFIFTTGLIVLAEWVTVFVPMWVIATLYGLHLTFYSGNETPGARNNDQLGIREAMIVTAAVAVVLGAASFDVRGHRELSINWEAVRVFGFLVGCGVLLAFPVTFGTLRARSRLLLGVGTLLFVAMVTVLALLLAPLVWPSPGIDARFCWLISLFSLVQSTWLVVIPSMIRLGGYRLFRQNTALR
jgi:hypothetical protein